MDKNIRSLSAYRKPHFYTIPRIPEFIAPQPVTFSGIFDEQFRVLSDEGLPLANVPYFIRDAAGTTYKGFTDAAGRTPRIPTPNQQSLQVSVGVHALEQWDQA